MARDWITLGPGEGGPIRLELRMLLLASAWFELDRRRGELGLDGATIEPLAQQVADAAYAALLARLGDYHGQSRFTTWAAKFAIHEACMAARGLPEGVRPPLRGQWALVSAARATAAPLEEDRLR